MDTVTLKTKRGVGSFEFRRETKMIHPESRKVYSKPVTYSFNFDNGFKSDVPKEVWESIKGLGIDKYGTRYCDILQAL
jgi:hypothetical protein